MLGGVLRRAYWQMYSCADSMKSTSSSSYWISTVSMEHPVRRCLGTERGTAGVTTTGRGRGAGRGSELPVARSSRRASGAVWALIEGHGVVVPMNVPGDGPLDSDDWRECWRHRVQVPVSNHKRVPMTGGPALPHAPRVLSTNPNSVRRLAQLQAAKREDRTTEAELLYRETMARKSRYLEHVKRGLEAPMEVNAYRAWSDEVRQLGVDWVKLKN